MITDVRRQLIIVNCNSVVNKWKKLEHEIKKNLTNENIDVPLIIFNHIHVNSFHRKKSPSQYFKYSFPKR